MVPSLFYADLLDFLQILSPSNRLIYESTALQAFDEDLDLNAFCREVLKSQPLKSSSKSHSIQITGPPGQGKVTMVKFLVQEELRSTPDALLLEVLLGHLENTTLDLRLLLRTFVHQIISRRPALFFHIHPLYLEHLKFHRTTTKEVLWTFLHILLRVSQDWKVVIAANNVHLWPESVKSSIGVLERFLQSLKSNYLFISSSTAVIPNFGPGPQVLNIKLQQTHIQAKTKAVLLSHPALQTHTLEDKFQKVDFPEFTSITNADRYSKLLARSFLLSTGEALDSALRYCPRTEDAISSQCIEGLHYALISWSSAATSWVRGAARPLRAGEFAVAIALQDGPLELSRLIPRLSRSIKDDIRRNLEVVLRVENDFVHFYSAETREFFSRKQRLGRMRLMQPLTDQQMGSRCLQYISAAMSKSAEDPESKVRFQRRLRHNLCLSLIISNGSAMAISLNMTQHHMMAFPPQNDNLYNLYQS
jgi:hypothetical protein